MIKITLDKIDRTEVLRFLGAGDAEYDENITAQINEAIDIVKALSNPRAVYAQFDVSALGDFLQGRDICAHLQGCSKAILCALTIGGVIDEKIRAASMVNILSSVCLDAAASAAVERTAEIFSDTLKGEYFKKSLYLTDRYSPGYGDFPVTAQSQLLNFIDAQRKVGLFATQSNILTPRKSITAVIGISDKPTKGKMAGCKSCALYQKCAYRKKGVQCYV